MIMIHRFLRPILGNPNAPLYAISAGRHSRDFSSDPAVPKNIIEDQYAESAQLKNGKIYDKKPFKMRLYPKKRYHWCLCGMSRAQPLCDGTHKEPSWKCTIKPVPFEVAEEKDYWLCNCKQTKLRPFCDGTHKTL